MLLEILERLLAQVVDGAFEPRARDADGHRLTDATEADESHLHVSNVSNSFVAGLAARVPSGADPSAGDGKHRPDEPVRPPPLEKRLKAALTAKQQTARLFRYLPPPHTSYVLMARASYLFAAHILYLCWVQRRLRPGGTDQGPLLRRLGAPTGRTSAIFPQLVPRTLTPLLPPHSGTCDN